MVNDATSVVLFNAVQKLDVSKLDSKTLRVIGDFLYLFSTSTVLGVVVSPVNEHCMQKLSKLFYEMLLFDFMASDNPSS